jgi:hypothetical protein
MSTIHCGGEDDSDTTLHLQQRVNENNQLIVRIAHGHVPAVHGGVT